MLLQKRSRTESWSINLVFNHQEVGRNWQRILRILGEWPEVYRNQMKNVLQKGRHVHQCTDPTYSDIPRTGTRDDIREAHLARELVSVYVYMPFRKQVACQEKKKNKVQKGFELTVDCEST